MVTDHTKNQKFTEILRGAPMVLKFTY